MNKNLIAVSSKIGGGKDTFFDFLLKKSGSVYENKKMAWKLKEIAEKLTGIPAIDFEKESIKNSYLPSEWNYFDSNGIEQRLTCREFMQKLGTEGLRDGLHKNVWVNSLFADYKLQSGCKHGCENGKSAGTSDVCIDVKHCIEANYPNWFISDCRFVNEANAIKERGGFLIRINRNYSWEEFCKLYGLKNVNNPAHYIDKTNPVFWGECLKNLDNTEEIQTAIKKIFHSSETSLDDYKEFDYVINNFGTLEDFENEINKCLNFLGLLN